MRASQGADGSDRGKRPGRNDPCPCGSGRKYKACCLSLTSSGRAPASGPASSAAARSSAAAATYAAQAVAKGRTGEAIDTLARAIASDPRNAELRADLGALLLGISQPTQALLHLDEAVKLQPRAAPIHVRRGYALEQLGWPEEAAAAYRQAISLAPRLAVAHLRLATVLLMQDLREEAAKSFRRAASLEPNTAASRLSRALALIAEDSVAAARTALQQVVALDPGNAVAHAQLGKILAESGDASGAFSAFDKVLRLDPRAAGYFYDLVRTRPLHESDRPLLNRMLDAMQRDDLHELQRVLLELALGKAYDDLGEHEFAMRHFLAANRRKSRVRPLDRALITARTDWQIRTFTREFLARHARTGSRDSTPILVLGMPRSGTTLVESVLACHSRVSAGQELSFWSQRGRAIFAGEAVPDDHVRSEIVSSYLSVLRGISDAPHVTDKKPDNFVWVGLVHWALPEARIVHCRRDPLDTCVSIVSNFFAPRPDFSAEPADLVFYYREYERLMAHWRAVLPADRLLDLDYEALACDPEPEIRRLLDFCGLEWEDACLHPERSTRSVNTASLWQVRQPIFKASIGRWRRYASQLDELETLRTRCNEGSRARPTQGEANGRAAT